MDTSGDRFPESRSPKRGQPENQPHVERRPAWLLTALLSVNLLWAAACIVFAVRAPAGVTLWGHGHLVGEGAFVAALAFLEWRYRRSILELRS